MPGNDTPTIFGLHPNADLTFRLKESLEMINTLVDTQPKEASGGGGLSREDQVKEKIEKELLPKLPQDFIILDVLDRLKVLKGPKGLVDAITGKYDTVPLNVFLRQEIEWFQLILTIVRRTMIDMIDAIDGTISMTPDIVASIDAVYDFRVPRNWQFDPTGVERSWLTPSLAGWLKGLVDRHYQLNNWISKERPPSFWLTGFLNPQGFLTSMKQEVTRLKKGWSLDEVTYYSEVKKDIIGGDDGRIEGKTLTAPNEGVFIHGLYMEGAAWNKVEQKLEDSQPKQLFTAFPILMVSAMSTAPPAQGAPGGAKNPKMDLELMNKTHYFCPVYKYPKRNDKYLIFRCYLKAEGANPAPNPNKGTTAPMKWKLAGVCLLCQKD